MPDTAFVIDFAAQALKFRFDSGSETTLPIPPDLATLETNVDRLTLYPRRREAARAAA